MADDGRRARTKTGRQWKVRRGRETGAERPEGRNGFHHRDTARPAATNNGHKFHHEDREDTKNGNFTTETQRTQRKRLRQNQIAFAAAANAIRVFPLRTLCLCNDSRGRSVVSVVGEPHCGEYGGVEHRGTCRKKRSFQKVSTLRDCTTEFTEPGECFDLTSLVKQ
jgi:hypothetical protein